MNIVGETFILFLLKKKHKKEKKKLVDNFIIYHFLNHIHKKNYFYSAQVFNNRGKIKWIFLFCLYISQKEEKKI